MSLLVMDSGTRTIKVWSADESLMEERLYSNIFGMTPIMNSDSPEGQMPPDEDSQEQQDEYGSEEGRDGIYPEEETDESYYESDYVITQVLEQEQPYAINVVLDRRARSRSIEMWGPLGESSFFLLRTPLEDIRSSAATANRLFGYVGVVLAIVGTLIAVWLSRRITKPLKQLTDISVRMKDLDFSAKYDGANRTELDILPVFGVLQFSGFLFQQQVAAAQAHHRRAVAAPGDRVKAADQLRRLERLGQIIIRAAVQPRQPVFQCGPGSEHQDGDGDLFFPEGTQHGKTVHAGQHDVENDRVILGAHRPVQAVVSVVNRINGDPLFFQQLTDRRGKLPVVLHQQYAHIIVPPFLDDTTANAGQQEGLPEKPGVRGMYPDQVSGATGGT